MAYYFKNTKTGNVETLNFKWQADHFRTSAGADWQQINTPIFTFDATTGESRRFENSDELDAAQRADPNLAFVNQYTEQNISGPNAATPDINELKNQIAKFNTQFPNKAISPDFLKPQVATPTNPYGQNFAAQQTRAAGPGTFAPGGAGTFGTQEQYLASLPKDIPQPSVPGGSPQQLQAVQQEQTALKQVPLEQRRQLNVAGRTQEALAGAPQIIPSQQTSQPLSAGTQQNAPGGVLGGQAAPNPLQGFFTVPTGSIGPQGERIFDVFRPDGTKVRGEEAAGLGLTREVIEGLPKGEKPLGFKSEFETFADEHGVDIKEKTESDKFLDGLSKEFADVDNDHLDNVAEINENPWISEGLRVRKINQENEKYQAKRNALVDRLNLFKDTQDKRTAITEIGGKKVLVDLDSGEIIKELGESFQKQDTQIIEAGGRKLLVNAQTGDVIQDFGIATSGGKYGFKNTSEGIDQTERTLTDEQIRAGIRNKQSEEFLSKQGIIDSFLLETKNITDADMERVRLIAGEMIPDNVHREEEGFFQRLNPFD